MQTVTLDKIQGIYSILTDKYNILGLKAEFEAEGVSLKEAENLSNLTKINNNQFVIKIGGVEANRDIINSINLGVSCIIAPMVESQFALSKFIKSVVPLKNQYGFEIGINIETVQAVKNIEDIVNSPDFSFVDRVVFGRSDFANSIGLKCKDVNSEQVFDIVCKISKIIEKTGKMFFVGGNVSANSYEFLNNLPYLSGYETRKIVFNFNKNDMNKENFIDGVNKAIEFEIEWLKSRENHIFSFRDEKRLNLLQKRIEN